MDTTETKRPQDDVPIEKIIHYIVKDYRRMYDENLHMKACLKSLKNHSKKYVLEKLKKLNIKDL